VSRMHCRLLIGLVAWALQQKWAVANFLGAPGASNLTQGGNITEAAARPRTTTETTTITTTTSKPLFPPKPGNDLVGSVDSDDTALTLKVILEGMESALEKFKKANAGLAKLTCKELDDRREEMETVWDDLKEKALVASFNAAKANAFKSKEIEKQKKTLSRTVSTNAREVGSTMEENKAARKTQEGYKETAILHMNVLEQYALKCGVKDKWCEIGDTAQNEKFKKLMRGVANVDARFTEAGWLRHQAVAEYATAGHKHSAEIRWGEAMRTVGEVWTDTKSLTFGLEVQTAACGLRPPSGPWATPSPKCNLKPSDPMMQALLRDDPQEFVRRWKEMIGKKAGLSPDKVVVDVSGCF